MRRTRACVSGRARTVGSELRIRDAIEAETPACRATSAKETRTRRGEPFSATGFPLNEIDVGEHQDRFVVLVRHRDRLVDESDVLTLRMIT